MAASLLPEEVNMVKSWGRPFLSVILLAAFSSTGSAQDAKAALSAAAKAMGTEDLRTVQYSGSGSIYDEKGQHLTMRSYTRRIDLNAGTSAVDLVRMEGSPPAPHNMNQAINSSSPWNTQFDFWLTPYGFLKGATANNATVEMKTIGTEPYRVVSYTLAGNHKITGYINSKDMVEKVETRGENDVLIQSAFHEYQDFGGVKVPTVVVQMRNNELSIVLIVKDAKPNG
jgi:hypothetical protein